MFFSVPPLSKVSVNTNSLVRCFSAVYCINVPQTYLDPTMGK